MNELSLHILDIVQNSISADASLIFIDVLENASDDKYIIRISDNGHGIDGDILENVTDPYVTSRTTRKVGMGLSLFKQNAEQTNGSLKVESEKGKGTTVTAEFGFSHIDRPILGDMPGVVSILAATNPKIDFVYKHVVNDEAYHFDTREVKFVLDDVPISNPSIQKYMKELIEENLKQIKAGR
jgi:hypothetical protein